MQSIISFPNRGPWGKSSWRGNCSGHVQKSLIEQFNPKLFVDVCEGSGTSRDVCRELGIDYVGLDIHSGFDFTKNSVIEQLPFLADLAFSHPPYHDMVKYSKEEGDISRCASIEEFLYHSQLMLMNQRQATKEGGIYTTLIGDLKRNGSYHSFQADYLRMMPQEELLNVVIKAQHNMMSNNTQYRGNFIPITHEYLLIWKKKKMNIWQVCVDVAKTVNTVIASTWQNLIRLIMMELKTAKLGDIYNKVEQIGGNLIKKNTNYQAKVRQILQKYHTPVERGVWAI